MLDSLKELVELINQAEKIVMSTADWRVKYDLVFGLGIAGKIREVGLTYKWYCPDMGYQEDVMAFMTALEEFKKSLGNLIED